MVNLVVKLYIRVILIIGESQEKKQAVKTALRISDDRDWVLVTPLI